MGLTTFWPTYFGRGAVRGLKDRVVIADVGGAGEAKPADQPRGEVADDVAEHVLGHKDVVVVGALERATCTWRRCWLPRQSMPG